MKWLSTLRQTLHHHSQARRGLEALVVALVVGAALSLAGRNEVLDHFERGTLDDRFNWYANPAKVHEDIVVVELTDDDLDSVYKVNKQVWPWPRSAYALAVDWLTSAGAKAVFLDFSFQDDHGRYPEQDKRLSEKVTAAGNVYILATFNAPVQRFEERIPALHSRATGTAPAWMKSYPTITGPLDALITGAKGIVSPTYGVDENDPEGVARRYPIGHAHGGRAFPSPAVALAADYLGQPVALDGRGASIGDRRIDIDERGLFSLNWKAKCREYNPKRFTLAGIIANKQGKAAEKYDPEEFRGKIVLIGAAAEGLNDFKASPLSRVLGVEIHAAALDTILQNEIVHRVPYGVVVAAIFGLALLAAAAGIRMRIRFLVPLVIAVAAGYVGLAFWLLGHRQIWLDVVSPVTALVLATTGSALVNYAVEGRQKRDIRSKFGTYLTPEYVTMLEENPGLFKLGGEERVGTAFFSDLSGFTAMSEKMTASELVSRMNEYLTLMTNSIKRFKGTVDKYEGDAIVAFWNAPIEQKDHAVLACRAALDNQKELAGLRERWMKSYGVSVLARIGLNTGKMIFGNMGSDDKFNYTMMGDPVNLAARLESANKDYGTYLMIGQDTYELVKDVMECRELDLIKVKGKQIPVTVYELLCEKGRLEPRTRECLDRYNLGLQAYRLKQFLAAEQRFLEALEIDPKDSPSKLYVERSRALVEKPPEPGWTYIYEKKDK
ncbi:MAG: adenylate/guanylate cyclase domain-containing protein [Planctomycetota bacterium]